MAREETLGPASHPSKIQAQPFRGEPGSDTTAPGVLVIAPPDRVLYLNENGRRLLAETQRVHDETDAALSGEPHAVSRSVQRLCARIFQPGRFSQGAGAPLEIKGLSRSLGSHLRVHGLLFHDQGDLGHRRAVVMFDRASPPH